MKPLMSECEYSEFQDDGGTDLEKPSKPPLCAHNTCDTMGTMTTKLSDRMFSLESRFSKLESVQASQAQQIAHLKLLSEIFSLKVLVANLITDRTTNMQNLQRQHHDKGECKNKLTDDVSLDDRDTGRSHK
ncbi:hypothetical protein N7494_000880 [Penicillium frequentans]|uniref:Uncharacterized protein n=1 Tax=Penicillium frequentans TaxID=3151616 RepID=A0AAD6D8K0_9EURO|nr:hypothetical protein N7494_000880 [Penicillium glabrum]